jgi:hypothetical protein
MAKSLETEAPGSRADGQLKQKSRNNALVERRKSARASGLPAAASQHFTGANLLHLGQSLVDQQTSDHQEHEPRNGAQHLYYGSDLVHLGHDFQLILRHVGFSFVQEELIVLLHSESTAIDEEDDQNNGETTPRNQQP